MPQADKDKPKILSKNLFPVVGIGASAGGLEAFKKLIKAIPEKTGMAYILVQQLTSWSCQFFTRDPAKGNDNEGEWNKW